MRTTTILTTLAGAAVLAAGSANAAVLLAGWDGSNAGAAGKSDITDITSSYTTSGVVNEGWNSFRNAGQSLWGTTAFTTVADTDTVVFGLVDGAGATITMTLTNSGTSDISLDAVHVNAYRDVAESPTGATFSFVSSTDTDLTAGTAATLAFSSGNSNPFPGYDQSITGIFAGTNVLSAGETVVLAWDISGGSDTENSRLRLDNLAISGSAIPEPSSAALLGLAGLALIVRRRR